MTDLELLAEKADELAREFKEPPTYVAVRAALNEAGVVKARHALADALDALAAAQKTKREADNDERLHQENVAKAVAAAEWELDGRFVVEGNKTYLTLDGDNRKAMTADERKRYKADEALKDPQVRQATSALRDAEHRTAEARDALAVADKRLSVARADLDAAVAVLNALTLALPARKAN